jgi:hypothetical protein
MLHWLLRRQPSQHRPAARPRRRAALVPIDADHEPAGCDNATDPPGQGACSACCCSCRGAAVVQEDLEPTEITAAPTCR